MNTYLCWKSSLCRHMGSPSVARLQRLEGTRSKREARDTGSNCTGLYGRLASSVDRFAKYFPRRHSILLTIYWNLCNKLESMQIHGKSKYFYRQWRSFVSCRCTHNNIHSHLPTMVCLIDRNGIFIRIAGLVAIAIVTILLFIIVSLPVAIDFFNATFDLFLF